MWTIWFYTVEKCYSPKTSVQVGTDTKLRGGMHVCLPQFGPDSKTIWRNTVSAEPLLGKSAIKMNRMSA